MTRSLDIETAVNAYIRRHNIDEWRPMAALIDMDGVLYDSMPAHARAWRRMMLEQGFDIPEKEFFLYEGMTGRATIEMLYEKHGRQVPSPEEVKRLYAIKGGYFLEQGERRTMPGAADAMRVLQELDTVRVLVTGSAQTSLLSSLEKDYPGAFDPDKRVTALDVKRGKPWPEPYLAGLKKAGVPCSRAIVIENAPLGVQAGHAAGCFTIGVTTGPIPAAAMYEAGADITFPSMAALAGALPAILCVREKK